MSRTRPDRRVWSLIRELDPLRRDQQQQMLLQRLTQGVYLKQGPTQPTPTPRPLLTKQRHLLNRDEISRDFTRQHQRYFAQLYRDTLHRGSVFAITRDLNKGFNRKDDNDNNDDRAQQQQRTSTTTTYIEKSVLEKVLRIPLLHSRKNGASDNHYELVSFNSIAEFLDRFSSDLAKDEHKEVAYVLVNSAKVPIGELVTETATERDTGTETGQNRSSVVNYETLLRQSKRDRNPVERLLNCVSSAGLLRVIVRDQFVVFGGK